MLLLPGLTGGVGTSGSTVLGDSDPPRKAAGAPEQTSEGPPWPKCARFVRGPRPGLPPEGLSRAGGQAATWVFLAAGIWLAIRGRPLGRERLAKLPGFGQNRPFGGCSGLPRRLLGRESSLRCVRNGRAGHKVWVPRRSERACGHAWRALPGIAGEKGAPCWSE